MTGGRQARRKSPARRNLRRPAAPRPALSVVHVEDNDDDALLLQMRFQGSGIAFQLQRAGDLADGIRLAGADPAVVLLDLDLPDSRGLDSVRRFRAAVPGVPVVVLTGRRDRDLGLQALALGAHDYIAKDDATSSSLELRIARAIQRSRIQSRFPPRTEHRGGLRFLRQAARPTAWKPAGRDPLVFVSLQQGARRVRSTLESAGVASSRLSVVAASPRARGPERDFDHITVSGPTDLEALVLATEEACGRMGPDCRVVLDDAAALLDANPEDRCVEFLRSLSARLAALGIAGQVIVADTMQGRAIESALKAGVAEASPT